MATKAGIRLENSELLNESTISPRASIAYKSGKHTQFSVAYGQFYQNPSSEFLKFSDDFTAEIIESNKRDIARVLSECIGQRVQVDSRLVKTEAEHRSNDPFERFKKLQEKDPVLRAVVELFGAELDYNI